MEYIYHFGNESKITFLMKVPNKYRPIWSCKMMESSHEGTKFPCTHCGSSFTQKGSLQKHMKSVHEGQKFPCPHCESTFTQKVHLQRHTKSFHEGQKFQCPQCEFKATQKGSLQKHIKSVHEGQKGTIMDNRVNFNHG